MPISEVNLQYLIDKAADFIGTDEKLRSWACIDSALDHAIWTRVQAKAVLKLLHLQAEQIKRLEELLEKEKT